MNRLLPFLAIMTQITRHSRAGAALLIAILAVVLFTGPPASAQSENEGLIQVTVSFIPNYYTVAEGEWTSVGVYLSDDPGREVIIPITATALGGASPADYSGVPQTVTFSREEVCFDDDDEIIEDGVCYERFKSFTIIAARDDDDDGEAVRLGFGAPLPAGVSGRPAGDGDSHHHRRRPGLGGVGAGWHRGHRGPLRLVRERQQRGVAVAAFGHRIRRLQRHPRGGRGHVEPVHPLGGRSGHVAQGKGHLR